MAEANEKEKHKGRAKCLDKQEAPGATESDNDQMRAFLRRQSCLRPGMERASENEMRYFIKSLKFMNGIKDLASGKSWKIKFSGTDFTKKTENCSAFHLAIFTGRCSGRALYLFFIRARGSFTKCKPSPSHCNLSLNVTAKKKRQQPSKVTLGERVKGSDNKSFYSDCLYHLTIEIATPVAICLTDVNCKVALFRHRLFGVKMNVNKKFTKLLWWSRRV